MPLYEYECDACGHRFEVIRKFSDPPVETCPKCGSTVHKLIAAPAFQFKGTGWYITDYGKKDTGKSDSGKSDASSKTASAPGEADKTDKTDKADKSSEKSGASAASPAAASSDASGSKGKSDG